MKGKPVKRPTRAAVPPCKPVCRLVGTDGNVFSIIGRVRDTLRKADTRDSGLRLSSTAP